MLAISLDGESVEVKGYFKVGYRYLILLLGIGSIVLGIPTRGFELYPVIIYSMLAAGMEASCIEQGYGSLSLTSGVVLAAGVTMGMPAAQAVAAAGYILADFVRRRFGKATIFGAAQATLAASVASYLYQTLGGPVGAASGAFAGLQMAFILAYNMINFSLASIWLGLETGEFLWPEYSAAAGWTLLAAIVAWPVGFFLSQIYIQLSLQMVVMAAIPLLVLHCLGHFYVKVRQAHQEITKLYSASRKIGTSIDLNTTLKLSLEQAQNLTPFDQGIVYLVDGYVLMPVAHQGPVPDAVRYSEVEKGQGLVGVAAQRRKAEIATRSEIDGSSRVTRSHQLALPLTAGEHLVGVLLLERQRSAFEDHEIQLLSILAGQVASALENARLYSDMAMLARLDGLTGVLNRRAVLENLTGELARCRRYDLRLSVLMVDLDDFKRVNDTFGHMAGDTLLRKITASIQAQVRSVDMVGRYGGDEIIVILPETTPLKAYTAAKRICAAVRSLTAAEVLPVTCSIGLAGYPQDGDTAEQLLAAADQAMYKAKELGGDRAIGRRQIVRPVNADDQTSGGPLAGCR